MYIGFKYVCASVITSHWVRLRLKGPLAPLSRRQPKMKCCTAAKKIGEPPNQPKLPATATKFSAGHSGYNKFV